MEIIKYLFQKYISTVSEICHENVYTNIKIDYQITANNYNPFGVGTTPCETALSTKIIPNLGKILSFCVKAVSDALYIFA